MYNIGICLIYIAIFFILLIITKYKYNTIFKINLIFAALWCFCGITSMYNNLGLIKPSVYLHALIIISIIIFNAIYLINFKKYTEIKENQTGMTYLFNKKTIYLLSTIAIILISPNLINAIRTIAENGLNLEILRNEVYVELTETNNFYLQFFTRNMPTAIFTVVLLIVSIELADNKKHNLWIAVVNIIIGTFTFGGRNFILSFVLFYISAIILMKKKNRIKIKKRYIAFGVFVLWIITYLRTGNAFEFIDMIIVYFSGSLSFLETIIQNPDKFGLDNGLMYGYMTFAVVVEPIVLVLKLFFGFTIKVPSYYFNSNVQSFTNISENGIYLYNNNTTMFYNFIMDFGIYGAFISIIILAIIIVYFEKKFYKTNKKFPLLITIYLYATLMTSSITYKLNGISTTLVILIIYIVSKKNKKIKENNYE